MALRVRLEGGISSRKARVRKMNWTEAQLAARSGAPPKHKYNARKKEVDGITFDSTAEAKAYVQLKTEQSIGAIHELEIQPEFVLQEAFRDSSGKAHRAIKYRADFQFIRCDCRIVVDVKGMETATWKIKAKMFLKRYPYLTLEIWKGGKRPC
jgi:hypothetical protein